MGDWLFILLLLAYICSPYIVAKRKGKNPYLWTFLCLFFFPSWLVLLFSKKEESSNKKKIKKNSIFKKTVIGAAGIKTYQNVYNKPIVVPPPGYVIRGLKQKGLGSTWVVTYSKEQSLNVKNSFTIRGTSMKAMSVGRDKFVIDWP